jgi:hypothetical protein
MRNGEFARVGRDLRVRLKGRSIGSKALKRAACTGVQA